MNFLDKTGVTELVRKIKELIEVKANKTDVPTKTSELTNDSNFIGYTKIEEWEE